MDVLGLLPGPALKSNGGACDILQGEAFAYGVSGSVAVVDVRTPPLHKPMAVAIQSLYLYRPRHDTDYDRCHFHD